MVADQYRQETILLGEESTSMISLQERIVELKSNLNDLAQKIERYINRTAEGMFEAREKGEVIPHVHVYYTV